MRSYICQPRKWIWGLVPLALPFVGAYFLNSPLMVSKIADQAGQTLKTEGYENLKLSMDGRDATLSGQAESKEAIAKAVKTILATKGVRRVAFDTVTVEPPVVLNKPTIKPLSTNNARPMITGTWPSKIAKTLEVKVGGKTYLLGKDKELTSDQNGNWTLKPAAKIVDGTHDIVVAISDGKKAAAADESKNELTIDTKAPKQPVIATKLVTSNQKPVISGNWDHKDAKSLAVGVGGDRFVLGKNKELVADEKGGWILTPLKPIKDGTYDITAETADSFGNVSRAVAAKALTIDSTPPQSGTVSVIQGKNPKPEITGKWDSAKGNVLKVEVGGNAYVSGKDKALKVASDGTWSLMPAKPLSEGKHDVVVTTTDAIGNQRTLKAPGVVVVDITPPVAPAVTATMNSTTRPVIKGTWTEKAGNSLRVAVAGKIFVFGRDKQLSSDGKGNWTLNLSQPLGEGNHSILAETSDAFGNLSRTDKPTIVAVDTTKPVQAKVKPLITNQNSAVVGGTWPNVDGNKLSVLLNKKTYVLGKDQELTSDSKGNWKLTPPEKLAEGVYPLVATVTDQAGNSAVTESPRAIVIDRTPPPVPTVTSMLTRDRSPIVTGTWDPKQAVELSVSFAGQKFSSKTGGQIKIDGEHWSVQPLKPVADGTYDVVAVVSDKLGNSATDTGKAELVIDATSPPPPTVRPVFGTNKRPPISGTWQEDGQNTLAVTFAGSTYSLGTDSALSSDGKGNWKLALRKDLEPGSYDVKVKVADRLGNQSNDASTGEIWVKEVKKVEPAPAPKVEPAPVKKVEPTPAPKVEPTPAPVAKIDCQREFTATLAGQSINFITGKAKIQAESLALINKLVDIAKKCPSAKIEVSGHTDSQGSAVYNQSLSEARASAVVDALVKGGVVKQRLRAIGYGENKPVGDNATKQGRAQNRRIEFKVDQ